MGYIVHYTRKVAGSSRRRHTYTRVIRSMSGAFKTASELSTSLENKDVAVMSGGSVLAVCQYGVCDMVRKRRHKR